MDPFETLANAIVWRAAEDYRTALRWYKKRPEEAIHRRNKKSIELFFRSEWFGVLTSLDPNMLLAKLREEARHD